MRLSGGEGYNVCSCLRKYQVFAKRDVMHAIEYCAESCRYGIQEPDHRTGQGVMTSWGSERSNNRYATRLALFPRGLDPLLIC